MTNEKNLGESAANQVRIYSPQSALRDPQRLVREMGRDLYASRELAWRLFVRDLPLDQLVTQPLQPPTQSLSRPPRALKNPQEPSHQA